MLASVALTVLLASLASVVADPVESRRATPARPASPERAARPEQRGQADHKAEYLSFITNNAPKEYAAKSKSGNKFVVYGLKEGTFDPTLLASVEPGQSAVYKLSPHKYGSYAFVYEGRSLRAYYTGVLVADQLTKTGFGFYAVETIFSPAKTPSGTYEDQTLTDFLRRGEGPKYPVINWPTLRQVR